VNGIGSEWHEEDVALLATPGVTHVLLPKAVTDYAAPRYIRLPVATDTHQALVLAEGLGHVGGQAQGTASRGRRGRSQAGHHYASDLD
jgi:hypothetical protein